MKILIAAIITAVAVIGGLIVSSNNAVHADGGSTKVYNQGDDQGNNQGDDQGNQGDDNNGHHDGDHHGCESHQGQGMDDYGNPCPGGDDNNGDHHECDEHSNKGYDQYGQKCPMPEPKVVDFTAKVVCSATSGTAVFTLSVTKTSGPEATFAPADGTVLPNGNPVEVTATWNVSNYETKTKTVTATGADDCTPIPHHGTPPVVVMTMGCSLVNNSAVFPYGFKVTGDHGAVLVDGAAVTLVDGMFSGTSTNVRHTINVTWTDGSFGEAHLTNAIGPIGDCTPVKATTPPVSDISTPVAPPAAPPTVALPVTGSSNVDWKLAIAGLLLGAGTLLTLLTLNKRRTVLVAGYTLPVVSRRRKVSLG